MELTKRLSHRHRIYRLIKKAFMLHAIADLQVLIDSIKEIPSLSRNHVCFFAKLKFCSNFTQTLKSIINSYDW